MLYIVSSKFSYYNSFSWVVIEVIDMKSVIVFVLYVLFCYAMTVSAVLTALSIHAS